MSMFGGGGGVPKLRGKERPSKAPKAPNRLDKNIRKPVKKTVTQISHTSSTFQNFLSAKADGVVGATSPTKSYTAGVFSG